MPGPGTLILLRHGQSVLNAQGRFSGLLDPALTDAGENEAADAGSSLASAGIRPALVFTSSLLRTRETARIVLDVLGTPGKPVVPVWELNERNYGCLTGRSRQELLSELGPDVYRFWRRSYYGAPPPMRPEELGALRRSPAVAGLPADAVRGTESLCEVVKRVKRFWHRDLRPAVLDGTDVLVVGHGNSLRALCMVLDDLREREVEELNIPTGQPLIYTFDPRVVPRLLPVTRTGEYLNPLAARSAAARVAAEGGT